MHKLIKKYLYGGEFARDKGLNYPNTTNVGAGEMNSLGISDWSSYSKDVIGGTILDDTPKKLTPLSLGDLSIFKKKNIFSNLGGGIKNIFGKAGGLGGVASVLGGIGESLLPKRITSKGMDIANGVLSAAENIPVYGKFATLAKFGINAIDSLGATTLDTVVNDLAAKDTLAHTGGGYGDFMDDWNEASELSGQRAGLFTSKADLNAKIHNANRLMAVLSRIIGLQKTNELLTALMGDRWNQSTMNLLNGGFGNISFGRLGLKIEILPKVHAILNKPKVVDTLSEFEEVQEFKEGGKMNVIPEGSLHARLHHMENAEGLTKKGIPVVSIAEGGELELLAEIELNEIIFNLEVTLKLEKLMKDGSDNAAIEAGKLLVKEIFENTDDRTGLIDKLTGGELSPEEAVKNHQIFQQGGSLPSLKSIEELVEYAILMNPAFVKRIGPDMGYAEFQDETGNRLRGTHMLGYTTENGKYIVYPLIQMLEGRLQYNPDWRAAYDRARRENNILEFDSEDDAKKFTSEYKKSRQWKQYFDTWEQRYGSYKYGGILKKLDTLSEEELLNLKKYLKIEEA